MILNSNKQVEWLDLQCKVILATKLQHTLRNSLDMVKIWEMNRNLYKSINYFKIMVGYGISSNQYSSNATANGFGQVGGSH